MIRFPRRRWTLAAALGAAAIALFAGWWFLRPPAAPPEAAPTPTLASLGLTAPVRRAGEYVGSAVCANCHAEISKSFSSHAMGRASANAAEAERLPGETADAVFSPQPSWEFAVERRGNEVYHHERRLRDDGTVIYDQAVPIHVALGSGVRGRSYVTQRGDLLFVSPISWYSQERRWDLSPGYAAGDDLRFERPALEGCIHCHVGRSNADPQRRERFREPLVLEGPISCERCHGPGADHVELHETKSGAAETIVNPARLDPYRRESVCLQCHLQGEERIVRFGRRVYDFRPGDPFDDVWIVLAAGTRAGQESTAAVSQVEQMWHSACYKHSDGRLGCISCHDPHASPADEARVDFYRARCLACHEERPCSTPEPVRRRTSAVDSCIECHMPPLSARDVPHTSQTDHRIRRHRDRPPPENEFREPRIVGARTDQLPQAEVDRAWGIWLGSLANDEAARAALERLSTIAALEGIDDETLLAAGTACRRLERNVEAERYWKRCLAANPESEAALFNLGQLYIAQRRWREARDAWEKFLKVNPWFAEPYGRYAQVLEALGERDAALAAARTGLERNPGLLPLRAWLAGACQSAGLEEEARMHRQIIEDLATSGRMP